jgi:hypothetical protein
MGKGHRGDPSKTRFIFAYTNDDVSKINSAVRQVRRDRGELGEDHVFETSRGKESYAVGDRLQFTGSGAGAAIGTSLHEVATDSSTR